VSDLESWLSNTQDRVETAQLVLSEVERGLVAVQKVETVAKRTRPVLRIFTVVIIGCLICLGIGLVVSRTRRKGEVEFSEVESPDDGG
jgi:NADH:ubiquinone oxidoreductase subunit K